jgi:hypothetical protein
MRVAAGYPVGAPGNASMELPQTETLSEQQLSQGLLGIF